MSWTEGTDHRRRRQRALGRLNPIEFELRHPQAATVALKTPWVNSWSSPKRLVVIVLGCAP